MIKKIYQTTIKKTNDQLHWIMLSLSLLFSAAMVWVGYNYQDWGYFQRSGAAMIIFAAMIYMRDHLDASSRKNEKEFTTFQKIIADSVPTLQRLSENIDAALKKTVSEDKSNTSVKKNNLRTNLSTLGLVAKNKSNILLALLYIRRKQIEEKNSLTPRRIEIIMVIIGTMIWGYGDCTHHILPYTYAKTSTCG